MGWPGKHVMDFNKKMDLKEKFLPFKNLYSQGLVGKAGRALLKISD